MFRPAHALAPLLLIASACDSGDADGGGDAPGAQNPPIEENQDDGSVAFADVYVADLSGAAARFFRSGVTGTCTDASLTLRFNAARFELDCLIETEDGELRYSPSGDFRYELAQQTLRVTALGYELNGTAAAGGERIASTIESPSGAQIEADFLALP